MNSYSFCKEFESFFGPCKKYKIKNKQSILATKNNLISSARSLFLYEMSLYLDMPVSRLKSKHNDICNYLFPLCQRIYLRLRKKFRKLCKEGGVGKYKSGHILHKCLHITDMYKTHRTIFYDCNFSCEHIIYDALLKFSTIWMF